MLTSLQNTWKSLTQLQRLGLLGVLAAAFGGLLLVARVAGRPSYAVLFSRLEAEDAGAVTAKLRELKVQYQLSDEGRAIEVPADRVHDLRLSLATEGLPRGGSVGFELFDRAQFGATDFTQRLNYQRALQGELSRTIGRLEGVMDARVHLALPERRLFLDKEEPVTASVVLHLKPGYQVEEERVAGIVHLVSAAVEGLKPEHVTVHDANGELLSSRGTQASLSGDTLRTQEAYERRLESQLRRLADQVLGPGKAAIRVGADMDWDQVETTSESYRPSGPNGANLPVEQQDSVESYGKNGPRAVNGIPGVSSNLGRPTVGTAAAPAADAGRYTNRQTTNRYVVNKVVERRLAPPGKLRRVSVAVLLDGRISRVQQTALKDAFAAAAGLDTAPVTAGGRGDQIQLVPMAFDRTQEKQEEQAVQASNRAASRSALIRNGVALGVLLLAVIVSLFSLRRLTRPRRRILDAVIAEPTPLPAAEEAAPAVGYPAPAAQMARSTGTEVAALEPEAELDLPGVHWDMAGIPVLAERLRRLAADRPAEVARQLQLWMTEEARNA